VPSSGRADSPTRVALRDHDERHREPGHQGRGKRYGSKDRDRGQAEPKRAHEQPERRKKDQDDREEIPDQLSIPPSVISAARPVAGAVTGGFKSTEARRRGRGSQRG
jgi:hypothetical protein